MAKIVQGSEVKLSLKVEDFTAASLKSADSVKAVFYVSGKKKATQVLFDRDSENTGPDESGVVTYGMKEDTKDSTGNTYIIVVPTKDMASGVLMGEVSITYTDADAASPVNDGKITEVYSVNPGIDIITLS